MGTGGGGSTVLRLLANNSCLRGKRWRCQLRLGTTRRRGFLFVRHRSDRLVDSVLKVESRCRGPTVQRIR